MAEYYVLVEENESTGSAKEWRVGEVRRGGDDRGRAREAARDLAFGYEPRHPMRERNRQVFQIDDDNWIVVVEGMTSRYHFRVSVARLVV